VKQLSNNLKGSLGIVIVKGLLESSGYTVCHYGYEYTMKDVLSKRTHKKNESTTGRRVRSSPDLLVYYDKDAIMFVEVKTRCKTMSWQEGKVLINGYELESLKEFWSDSILAIVVPEGIYAQRVSELEIQQNGYQPLTDFREFKDVFLKVKSEYVAKYREIASQIFEIFATKKEPYQLEIETNIK
jgi:hypothetical protein